MMRSQKGMLVSQPEEWTSINDLPETILVHILSFLPLEETVRTSVLAQSWRNLWLSVPTLSFDMYDFQKKISKESFLSFNLKIMAEEKSGLKVCEQFCELISNTLHRRPQHLALQKFKLQSRANQKTLEYIDSWLQLLIPAKVVELDLDFVLLQPKISDWNLTLFFDLSVEVLRLKGIEVIFPKDALPLRLESIREVHLKGFSSTDKDIADVLASCVHLETLSLASSDGCLKNLKIVSQQLKHLKLGCLNCVFRDKEFSVEICAPSLISLDLLLVYTNKFTVKGSSSLVEAQVRQYMLGMDFKYWTNIVSYLSGVERLNVETIWPYDRLQPEGLSETFIFRNLKHVDLLFQFSKDDILGMESILKLSPQLATMVLECRYGASKLDPHDFPNEIVFQVPHLRVVEIKLYKKTEMEMYIVDLLKKHGLVLEKIVAYPVKVNGKSQPAIVL